MLLTLFFWIITVITPTDKDVRRTTTPTNKERPLDTLGGTIIPPLR